MITEQQSQSHRLSLPTFVAFLVFVVVAAFYLWTEHRAHLLGVLPYLIFLVCPLMHFFMHRGGSGHNGHGKQDENTAAEKQEGHRGHTVGGNGP